MQTPAGVTIRAMLLLASAAALPLAAICGSDLVFFRECSPASRWLQPGEQPVTRAVEIPAAPVQLRIAPPPPKVHLTATSAPSRALPAVLSDSVPDRLRQLGVRDYRLERLGDAGHLIRCCCRIDLADDGNLQRVVQALADSADEAIEAVALQIEGGRGAGL